MARNPTIGMFVGDAEIERRERSDLRNPLEHHGECPWCLAHPHREPCSDNCKAAREAKETSDGPDH